MVLLCLVAISEGGSCCTAMYSVGGLVVQPRDLRGWVLLNSQYSVGGLVVRPHDLHGWVWLGSRVASC